MLRIQRGNAIVIAYQQHDQGLVNLLYQADGGGIFCRLAKKDIRSRQKEKLT